MTIDELVEALLRIAQNAHGAVGKEDGHRRADELLLDYIEGLTGDPRVRDAYGLIDKWYA